MNQAPCSSWAAVMDDMNPKLSRRKTSTLCQVWNLRTRVSLVLSKGNETLITTLTRSWKGPLRNHPRWPITSKRCTMLARITAKCSEIVTVDNQLQKTTQYRQIRGWTWIPMLIISQLSWLLAWIRKPWSVKSTITRKAGVTSLPKSLKASTHLPKTITLPCWANFYRGKYPSHPGTQLLLIND